MHRSYNIATTGTQLGQHRIGALQKGVYDGKIAGLYDLEETLGRGHFAVVKLAKHVFTGEKVAVKVIDKSKLDEVSKAHLFQEVRCMKLVQHPNVVRLYEVIDTATKLYLILELGDGGDLYDYIMRHDSGLSEAVAKEYFRQIVRAITYCHQLHVVHRDLKPENVVFFQKLGVVKLTDFGFSNKFCPGQKLETSCGSLAYSAPEILLGDSYDAPAVDVWSLGVILYMLVCGQAPFQEANDSETLTMIMDCKYTVPAHVSPECKDLIARMLVRAPEKRATLAEISAHQWLAMTNQKECYDMLPLVSKEQLSDDDHNLIVQKIVNGNIATKEEIQDCLDKNEYNHITATYFLLAERKLRAKRQEMANKGRRPENLAVPPKTTNLLLPTNNNGSGGGGGLKPTPSLLSVPRTPGDVPQRSRKCSIVQEDEEEEDISHCSGREELSSQHNSLNRRGSRSEGRLNLALQERLADADRRKAGKPEGSPKPAGGGGGGGPLCKIKTLDHRPKSAHESDMKAPSVGGGKWKMERAASIPEGPTTLAAAAAQSAEDKVTTTILTEANTIHNIPIQTKAPLTCPAIPKYRTMPAPSTRTTHTPDALPLNEIFEEGDGDSCSSSSLSRQSQQQQQQHPPQPPPPFVNHRNQTRATYEQRRSKFHKTRTASCSSSDASDDDSENRKKRAHKLSASSGGGGKPAQARRDSHDDSSDSQEPGNGCTGTGNNTHSTGFISNSQAQDTKTKNNNNNNNNSNSNTSNTSGRKHNGGNSVMLGRRHKASRRRSGETRLRESQSLNRITEEDGSIHTLLVTSGTMGGGGTGGAGAGGGGGGSTSSKSRSFGARILQGLNISGGGSKRPAVAAATTAATTDGGEKIHHHHHHNSRKDATKTQDPDEPKLGAYNREEKENCKLAAGTKKMRLLGRYFQVHKRIFMPIPSLFSSSSSKNKLYKARSCGSLTRDKVHSANDEALRQRAASVIRNSVGSAGDINQNMGVKTDTKAIVVKNVRTGLTDMCVHLGHASKCSFC